MVEYEIDGHTYNLHKLGLSAAKECLAQLTSMEFFDKGIEALIAKPKELDALERMLLRQHVQWLNEKGDWLPLGKELTEKHFEGRLESYFALLVKMITFNFESFLAGGWITSLGVAEEAEE